MRIAAGRPPLEEGIMKAKALAQFQFLHRVAVHWRQTFFFFFGRAGSLLLHAGFLSCGKWRLLFNWHSHCSAFSCCGAQTLGCVGSVVTTHGLWRIWASVVVCTGLVVPQHVGSFQTRDQTCVPCIGRWTLNHCTTREVPKLNFWLKISWKEILRPRWHHWRILPIFKEELTSI